ncbi:MAG TPA: threonine/serine dehydratase [Micromonosporaceae bacterium]|nr:threonine/serine dehydratase [Micromonosporaceae bacterium]
MDLVSIDDVRAAAKALDGVAVRTPVLACPWAGGPGLWVKAENLQPIGAFKLRGAYNAVSRIPAGTRANGVVTHSSGNHGRALAYAAREFGVPAAVVMPDVAPPVKIEAVRALGAEVVLIEPAERLSTTTRIAAERGMTVVPPFDDRQVIAGQGTVGLEIVEDFPRVEVVLVPVGGGGLASGVATAVKALRPDVRVYGVEPELAAETAEGLRLGHMVTWPEAQTYRTVADGVRTAPSELTFAHMRERLDGIVTVDEDRIRAAVGLLAREANLVVEPSGALGVAAYLDGGKFDAGRTVAVLSGGNLDPKLLAELVTQP